MGAGFLGTLGLTAVIGAVVVPSTVAGATNPSTLNCGTLVISGTDNTSYQFTEFTTGNATRGPNVDSGGSVAYGGSLTASNFTVAQNSTVPAATPTALVGGNETGQLNLLQGSAVVAGPASGPINLNGGSGTTNTVGGGPSSIPFDFAAIGSALAACSNNYGPNGSTTSGTITQLNPGFSTLGFYGTGSVNVFNVSTDQLQGVKKIAFSVPTGSTTLVEITPSADFNGSLDLSGIGGNIFYSCPSAAPSAANSLWNNGNCGSQPQANENSTAIDLERNNTVWNLSPSQFPAADSLTVAGFQGTIVAPNQAVTLKSNSQVNGSVFAASLSGGGQTNFDPFGGTMPSSSDPIPALPDGLPLEIGSCALAGLAALGIVRHRRRAQTAPSL